MNPRQDDYTTCGARDWRGTGQRHGDTGARIRAYLRGLTAEHWLLFSAGLVIGLILG